MQGYSVHARVLTGGKLPRRPEPVPVTADESLPDCVDCGEPIDACVCDEEIARTEPRGLRS